MKLNNKQSGSSTTGLLTATAIYAGLLAYATFFAFEKAPETVSEKPFKIDTHQTVSSAEPVKAVLEVGLSSEITSVPMVAESAEVPPSDETTKQIAAHNDDTKQSSAPIEQVVLTQQSRPVSALVNDGTQQDFANNGQLRSQFNNNYAQYLNANNRAYGRGNGAANGNGEFNFSMKFSSRARMDADSQINSRLQNAYYANQYVNYQQLNGIQPDYQMNY